MGHALVHFRQFLFQFSGPPVEHHQNGGRAEGPAAALLDADGGMRHPAAGAAVETAHGADVVVAEEAHNEVALSQQIAPLFGGQLRVFLDGGHQQVFQFQHPGDLPPVEHAAHQHQQGKGMGLEDGGGALVQDRQHVRGLEGRQQNAGIRLNDPQQCVIIAAPVVGCHGVEVLAAALVPRAVPFPVGGLLCSIQHQKGALRALLHHVVKAVGHAVRQAFDEGVLLRQSGEQRFRAGVLRDEAGHLHGELVGKAHDRQKFPLPGGEGIDHGGSEHGGDVGAAVRQGAPLRKGPQIQIDGGKPALAVVKQSLHLLVGKLRAAPVGVDGKLRVVQAQLPGADLIDPAAQPDDLRRREEQVPAGDDQVRVFRQAACGGAEKGGGPAVRQQVKVVNENVAGGFAGQLMAEAVGQQAAAGRVRGAGVVLKEGKACPGKGILHAPPENGQVVGVDADADHPGILVPGPLRQIPVYRRGLAVAHGGHDGGQGTAGDGPQALLQPL